MTTTDLAADRLLVQDVAVAPLEHEPVDGTSIPLVAGTAVQLRAGDRTRWIIYETLRKLYVLLPDHSKETTS